MRAAPVIAVFGRTGQVGTELQRSLQPVGKLRAISRADVDLSDSAAIIAYLDKLQPAVIVNAAAYTAVDKAEQEPELAHQINAAAPAAMAQWAARAGALVIHYSTDYVFDGQAEGIYSEADPTGPVSSYGRSKLAGEQAIIASGAAHLILRTAWVYGGHGGNFMLTMLRLMREREQLGVVADQRGIPTCSTLIADVTAHVLLQALRELPAGQFQSGVYHLCATGEASWHEFASTILALAQQYHPQQPWRTHTIEALTTAQYPTPAKRPANSVLATRALAERFGLFLPDWRDSLATCIQQMKF